MKTNFSQSNRINNNNKTNYSKPQISTLESKKREIEYGYDDFIANLHNLAVQNGMTDAEVYKQIQLAQSYKNTELGKLDLLG